MLIDFTLKFVGQKWVWMYNVLFSWMILGNTSIAGWPNITLPRVQLTADSFCKSEIQLCQECLELSGIWKTRKMSRIICLCCVKWRYSIFFCFSIQCDKKRVECEIKDWISQCRIVVAYLISILFYFTYLILFYIYIFICNIYIYIYIYM